MHAPTPPQTLDDRPGFRFRHAVLYSLVVLLLLEGTARLAATRLQPVDEWPSSDYTRHADNLDGLGNDVDTLVVGSSTVGVAIRPSLLREAGIGYNHWLAGPPMRSIATVTRDILLDRVDPEVVVIGVTMREFNDAPSQRAHVKALESSYGFQNEHGTATWSDHADEVLRDVSALARYRDTWRDPIVLVRDLKRGPLPPEEIAPDGHLADRGQATMADESPIHFQQERDAMVDYRVSDEDVAALDSLLAELDRRNIGAIVVNLPVSDTFVEFAKRGQHDQSALTDRLEPIVRRHSAVWVDAMDERWDEKWFADVNHLNDLGEVRLRPRLAEAISEATRHR